jgi:hypothetical protein
MKGEGKMAEIEGIGRIEHRAPSAEAAPVRETPKPPEKPEVTPEKKGDRVDTGKDEDKDVKKDKEAEDKKKQEEIDKLKEEIEKLKKLLEEMLAKKDEEKKAEKGGGGQKPQGAQQAAPAQEAGQGGGGDWDSRLMQDVMQVIQEKTGGAAGANQAAITGGLGGMFPTQAVQGIPNQGLAATQGFGGGIPVQGIPQMGGMGGQMTPAVANLVNDWQECQRQGAPIRQETAQLVQGCLTMCGVPPQVINGQNNVANDQINNLFGQIGALTDRRNALL